MLEVLPACKEYFDAEVSLWEILPRLVFILALTLYVSVVHAAITLYVSVVHAVLLEQPQWLLHAYVRATVPSTLYLRYGRRFGEDPKENLLTYDPNQEELDRRNAGTQLASRRPKFAVRIVGHPSMC